MEYPWVWTYLIKSKFIKGGGKGKMICIVETPVDLANFVELNNLIVNEKGRSSCKSISVSALYWADFSQMIMGEKLYLLGHGDETSIGEYSAEKLVDSLIEKKLPWQTEKIILVSCMSGVKGGGDPLSVQVYNELVKKKGLYKKIKVTGFSGYAVTDEKGRTRAICDDDKEHDKKVKEILKLYVKEIKMWENTAKGWGHGNQEQLVAGARTIAASSKEMFGRLYLLNKSHTKSRKNSKIYGQKANDSVIEGVLSKLCCSIWGKK